ncbi:hypothetical protein BX666DRAFT_1976001 [Dichotomocladium elegans]|nr:hypothetical protein BX666DRAFT_1976001 [Dichotomocladium elegans]
MAGISHHLKCLPASMMVFILLRRTRSQTSDTYVYAPLVRSVHLSRVFKALPNERGSFDNRVRFTSPILSKNSCKGD